MQQPSLQQWRATARIRVRTARRQMVMGRKMEKETKGTKRKRRKRSHNRKQRTKRPRQRRQQRLQRKRKRKNRRQRREGKASRKQGKRAKELELVARDKNRTRAASILTLARRRSTRSHRRPAQQMATQAPLQLLTRPRQMHSTRWKDSRKHNCSRRRADLTLSAVSRRRNRPRFPSP